MQIKPTVSFHTLGCKLNFAETSTIGRQFKEAGYHKIEFDQGADIVVINTCSVTEQADKECRNIIRRALNKNPESFVVVTGCYAQLKSEEIAAIDGVDLVLGASEKFKVLDFLDQPSKKEKAEIHSCEVDRADFFTGSYSLGDHRTRAFLKVQDGCDYNCSYCTIPLARGKSRSDTIENIIKSAHEIASQGVREIVLTGVNIGDFGSEIPGQENRTENFLDLIRALDEVEGIDRFRISSIEPNLLKNEIIEFVAKSKRFAPHFHIPLQSGSDKILGLMRRRYRKDLFADRIKRIKSLIPDCCIGVDVICGFPGETEVDFLETFQFLNDLDISYLHVFTYSERDHTEALQINEVVPVSIRRQRNHMLRILSEKKLRHFYEQHTGSLRQVLFELSNKDGMMHGFTENYIKVRVPYNPDLYRELVPVELTAIETDLCASGQLMLSV